MIDSSWFIAWTAIMIIFIAGYLEKHPQNFFGYLFFIFVCGFGFLTIGYFESERRIKDNYYPAKQKRR